MENSSISTALIAINQRMVSFMTKDLSAMSDEQAIAKTHPDFRSAIQVVAHSAGTLRYFTALVVTGKSPETSDEQRQLFMDSIQTKAQALMALNEAANGLFEAIESVPVEAWNDTVVGGLGEMPRIVAATFPACHTAYHDGQLNQMHVMNGDHDMHWF